MYVVDYIVLLIISIIVGFFLYSECNNVLASTFLALIFYIIGSAIVKGIHKKDARTTGELINESLKEIDILKEKKK